MKNLWITFVFMLFSVVAMSQWTSYTTTNSNLVNNDVESIAQDASGNMWFATEGGVSKFDGTTWTNYTSTGTGMNGNSVQDIMIKGNGDVWVVIYNTSSNGGVFSFNGTTWTDRTSNISNTYLRAIYDNSGTTWVGGLFEGLCKRVGNTWTKYTTTEGLVHNNVMQVCSDLSGNIWAATASGVSKFDGATTFTNYTSANGLITHGDEVLSIACGPDGVIWTGSKKGFSDGGGISRFDGSSWTTYYSLTKWWTIEAIEPVNSYYCWFGIGGGQPDGARIFNGTSFYIVNTSTSSLVDNNMNDIFIDNQNGIWFATDNGISHLIPELDITSIDVDNVTCGQGNNGEITINASSTYPDRFYSINGGSTYSSSNTFSNLTAGTYYIAVTDSATATVLDTVEILDVPVVKFSVSQLQYCQGDTGFLYTNATNFTWTPNTDVNDATPGVVYFTSDVNQTYYVSMTDSNGCSVDDTLDIIVNPSPTANVTITNDSVFTANGGYLSYQWYFYGTIISGATDSVYTAHAPGIYTVAVSNSSCTTYSDMIHYNNAGVEEYEKQFSIYPNPSNGNFTIETSLNTEIVIEVMDIKGQLVYKTTRFIDKKMHLDLSNLSKSLYFVRIFYDDKMEVRQLMIK